MSTSYDKALDAVIGLFGDRSISQSETKRQLKTLIGEIEILIDTLDDDEGDDQ